MASLRPTQFLSIAPPAQAEGANLSLYVVFTGLAETKWALNAAIELAHELDARLTLLVAQVVPYPLPLDSPPVGIAFSEQILEKLARQVDADITVKLCLCRDRNEAIREALRPGPIVIIGSRNRWWPNKERILARLLTRDGHNVIVVKPNQLHPAAACLTKARTSLR